jgi:hypothetical protein
MPKGNEKKKMEKKNKNKGNNAKKSALGAKALRITGRGAYKAPGLLGAIGKTAGSYFGGPVGGWVGNKLGNWLGSVTGLGSYHVKQNSILQGTVPSFGVDPGSVVVSHREFITDIFGATAFTLLQFPLNPGMRATFPWLSLMAAQYEEYEMLGMLVEFKTTSANALNSTNTALGTVIIATDYDCSDPGFTNKQAMEAYQYSTSCSPAESMLHPIECAKNQTVLNRLYIRSGAVPVGFDQRFFDMGVINVAVAGMQAAANIGELWVTYHVKFLKPKLPTPSGQNLLAAKVIDCASLTSHPTVADRMTANAANPFGAYGYRTPNSTIPSIVTNNSFTIPYNGQYLVAIHFDAGTGAAFTAAPSITLGGGLTYVTPNAPPGNYAFWDGVSVTPSSLAITWSATSAVVLALINSTNNVANTITVVGPTSGTTVSTDVFIVQVPNGLCQQWLSPLMTASDRLAQLEELVGKLVL